MLVIEDSSDTAALIRCALEETGYEVIVSDLISSGFNLFQNQQPALVIVDVDLPDGSGLDLCRKIRAHKVLGATPVIVLTGHSDARYKMMGFSAGADQYLTKPIELAELQLWVNALLKRVELDKGTRPMLDTGDLLIDAGAHLIKYKNEEIGNLTGREFGLLQMLVREKPRILSRRYILSKIWNTVAVEHLVDTHIYNLRKKLPPELAVRIQSVPGKGFRFC